MVDYTIHVTGNQTDWVTYWFNEGTDFPIGAYIITASGWYNIWVGTYPNYDAWTNPVPPEGFHIEGDTRIIASSFFNGIIAGILEKTVAGKIGISFYNIGSNNDSDATFVLTSGYVYGHVYHIIDYLESTTTYPLKNAKVDIILCWEDPFWSIVDYQHTYSNIYTNSNGIYCLNPDNPFNIWEPAYWLFGGNKLVSGEGWNKVYVTASTCSTSNKIKSDYKSHLDNIYLNHTLTEAVDVKNENDNSPVEVANVSMYQAHLTAPSQLTSYLGRATFTVYPENITHHIQKTGYRTYTPIYTNLKNTDCQTCGVVNTALLTPLPLDENAFILFTNKSSIGYYPNQSMVMDYNVGYASTGGFRTGAYANILRPDKTLAARIPSTGGLEPPNSFYYSPPPLGYSPTTVGMRGDWIAQLMDNTGSEIANASVFFGTKGTLGYDTSAYCTEKKITITWSGLDPVNAAGTQSDNYMRIKVYDGNNVLKHTRSYLDMNTSSGSFIYTFSESNDISKPWKVTLTDQWGIIINTKYMNIYSCNQYIFGKILQVNGAPIPDTDILLDLTSYGYGTFPTTSSSTGSYMISGIPPFSSQPLSAAKTGYPTVSINVTVEPNQFLEQNFILGGLLTGTVTDVEGKPIHRAGVWIFGKCYGNTDDHGIYNISLTETGIHNLNVIKNNFIINTKSVNLPNLITAITTNFTLTRKSQETYTANFPTTALVSETSGIQCDDLTTSTINISGQQIALADYTNSIKGSSIRSVQTGRGLYEIEPVYINDYTTRVIQMGGSLTLEAGFVIKVEDINLYTIRMAILVLLHDGDIIETQIVYPNTVVVFEGEVNGESYYIRLGIGEIFAGKEVDVVFIESVYQGTQYSAPTMVANIAQIFETDFNFNHFKVVLINDAYIYENFEFVQTKNAPCRVNVMLYDESGYNVVGTNITFGTPIFKDTVVLLPGTGQYIDFYCKTQPPGHYCIQMKMPDDEVRKFRISGMAPNLYYDSIGNLMKAYRDGIETDPSISLKMVIYEAPMQTERYLIRGGASDVSGQYTTDAANTNLVIIE